MSKQKNDDEYKRYQLRKEAAEMDAKLAGLQSDLVTAEQDAADCDLTRSAIWKWIALWILPPLVYLFLAIPFPSLALVLTMFWLMGASWVMATSMKHYSPGHQIGFFVPFTMIQLVLGFTQKASTGTLVMIVGFAFVIGLIMVTHCVKALYENNASQKAKLDEAKEVQRSIDTLAPLVKAAHELANPPETNVEEGDDFGDCTPHPGDGPQPLPA